MPTAEIDGVELAYDERGEGSPVLLMHGSGGNVWGALPEQLAAAAGHVLPASHPQAVVDAVRRVGG